LQPFAIEARDFIRRALVGRVIQFRVLYTLPTGVKRDYGTITLQDGQQLPELGIAEGYLKLRDDAGRRDESEEVQQLVEKLQVLEARAKADSKGVWGEQAQPIQTSYELSNPQDFVQKYKGQPLDGIPAFHQDCLKSILTRIYSHCRESP